MQIARFFFIYYIAQGCLIPYLPPYYTSLGLSGSEMALLASIAPLIMVVAPPVWGFLADRSGRPVRTMQIAVFGSAICFLPMFLVNSLAGLAAVLAGQGLFSTAISALSDTVAVAEARRIGTEYGRLRLWGSLGFVVGAYGFGAVLSRGYGLNYVLLSGAVGLALAALMTLPLPQSPPAEKREVPALKDVFRLIHSGAFVAFLVAGTLHWAAMQSYYLLFALRIKEVRASPVYVGVGIACGIATEILLMWSFRGLLKRVPLMPFLTLSLLSSAVRWTLTAWMVNALGLAAIQTFHGLSFAVFYVGSIAYLDQTMPAALRATGRALLASFSLGLGGILGNLIAGRLLDYGGTSAGHYGAALLEIAALLPLAISAALTTSGKDAKTVASQ